MTAAPMRRGPTFASTTAFLRRALFFVAALVGLSGCGIDDPAPVAPDPTDPPPGDPRPARVLVLNGLSWTISVLDLESGTMTPFAAPTGDVPNRFIALPDQDEIAVIASGDNEVQFHDTHALGIRAASDVGSGSNPYAGTVWGTHLLASNWLSGELVDIDVASRSVLRRLPTSAGGPQGVLVAGSTAYVACTHYDAPSDSFLEGRLDVIDLAAWSVGPSIPVPLNPQEVRQAPDGRIHVVCTGTNSAGADQGVVAIVDPATRAVIATVPVGGSPGRLAFAGGNVAWLAGWWGGIRRYDASSLAILPPPADPDLAALDFSAVAWDSTGATIYLASFDSDLLIAVDESSGMIRDAWIVGDGPVDVLVQRP